MLNWKYYVLPAAVAVAYLGWLLVQAARPEEAQTDAPRLLESAGEALHDDEAAAEDDDADQADDAGNADTGNLDEDPEEIPEAMDAVDALERSDEAP